MGLFAIRDYRRLFSAQVIALFGTGLATVALGLLAYDLAGPRAGAVLATALTIKMVAYVVVAPLAAWIGMELVGWYAIVPLALGSLTTGLLMGAVTKWGLLRHYWVLISLVGTVVLTAVLIMHMPDVTAQADRARTLGEEELLTMGSDIAHAVIILSPTERHPRAQHLQAPRPDEVRLVQGTGGARSCAPWVERKRGIVVGSPLLPVQRTYMPYASVATGPFLRLEVERRDRHWWLTVLALVALAIAAAMALFGLPPIDLHGPLHKVGIMDPLCGGTRAARYAAQGNLVQAWRYNPLSILIVAGAALAVLRTFIGLISRRWLTFWVAWTPRRRRWVIGVGLVLLVLLEIRQQMRADLLTAGTDMWR